jgi:hypothetical protein
MWLMPLLAPAWAGYHTLRLVDAEGVPFGCVDLETLHHVRFRTDASGVAAIYEPGLTEIPVWLTPSAPTLVPPVDGFGLAGLQVLLTEDASTEIVLERVLPEGDCDEGDRQQRLLDRGLPGPADYHALQVVDAQTGRPVPLVRLTALGQERWTDNGGHVAFFDLDAMDDLVRFEVWTHGYVHDPGYVELVPAPGATTVIEVDRINLAERLVRQTGAGAWRDTVLLGLPTPAAEPVLDGEIVGQDGGQAVPFRGQLFWMWGDTGRAAYPLGNFWMTGARAALDGAPEDGVDLDYFEGDDGFARGIAPRYPEGVTWLGGLVALDDEELWATLVNVGASFENLREGMARWDDATESFVEVFAYDGELIRPYGNALRYADWIHYGNLVRVPADPASLADPSTYEAYTPLVPDGSGGYEVTSDWQWRSDAPPWLEAPPYTVEPDTGELVQHAVGTIAWNPWRGRWIQIIQQNVGTTSWLGELWYAEADTPVGPWSWARKIITHDNYTFYNPFQHPHFASRGGRRILFEGTYTGWLAAHPPTPRHDYNQLFYGLDLDAPEMALPVPFYETEQGPRSRRHLATDAPVWFGAQELPSEGRVAVRWTAPECDPDRELAVDGPGETVFYAMPGGTEGPGLMPLNDDDGNELVRVWAPTWQPPVPLSLYPAPEKADAGPDLCGAGPEVQLDGSASVLAEGITSYTWTWTDGEATGAEPVVTLPAGLHVLTLTVEGPSGSAEDVVVIDVVDPGDPGEEPGEEPEDPQDPQDPMTDEPPKSGCGCQQAPAGQAPAGLVLWALLALRARRRA